MECPKCGLLNPPSAVRCDCGWDFAFSTMKQSYLAASAASTPDRASFGGRAAGQLQDGHSTVSGAEDRRALRWLWALLVGGVAALRIAMPPAGLDRRVGADDLVVVLVVLASAPLVLFALIATTVHLFRPGRRTWWPHHLSLAAMGTLLLLSAGYGGVGLWDVSFVPLPVFLSALLGMALSPRIRRFITPS